MENKKPILCLDFDGVCHSYTSGWKGADVIPDLPVPDLIHFIVEANQYFDIQIFSSRSNLPGGLQAMKDWFEYHFPHSTEILSFPTSKPAAFIGIDDRVLTFNGTFPNVEILRNFKAWNKK